MLQAESQGAVTLFRGEDPLVGDAVQQAAEVMQSSMSRGQPLAVLDLQGVPLIDSAGLELLAQQQEEFERNGGCLKIAAPNPLCRDILRCTGLDKRFEMHVTGERARGGGQHGRVGGDLPQRQYGIRVRPVCGRDDDQRRLRRPQPLEGLGLVEVANHHVKTEIVQA